MAFTYDMQITFTPPTGSPGRKVSVSVKLTGVAGGEVKSVNLTVPQGDIFTRLLPQQDGSYGASLDAPWEAPRGEYMVNFYAVSQENEKGPMIRKYYTLG